MSTLLALSEDIIIGHILTRLPVKSLKRFKCVCKSWLYILSNPDPHFITTHITHTSQNPDNECLIIKTCNEYRQSIHILSRSRFSYTHVDNIPRFSKIVGSINGLVCLIYNHLFLLWNPVTGLGKTIVPPRHYWQSEVFCEVLYGFGWDYVESEFKVFIFYKDVKSLLDSLQGFVYTSNSDSWNGLVIPDIFYRSYFFAKSDIIVEGSPYWNVCRGNKKYAVKFESDNNRFKEFMLPCQITRNCHYMLANVKDCPTLMLYSRAPETLVDVFFLDEECGVWSKTYTFGPIHCFPGKLSHCFKFGGEIVLDDGKMLYDPKTKGIKILGDGLGVFIDGCNYSPSLVFLHGMEQLNTQSHWRSAEVENSVLTRKQSHPRLLFSRLLQCLGRD